PSGPDGIARRYSASDRVGRRDAAHNRSYSSYETTTAVSMPRRVTICGTPFAAASTTALSMFFAALGVQRGGVLRPPVSGTGPSTSAGRIASGQLVELGRMGRRGRSMVGSRTPPEAYETA